MNESDRTNPPEGWQGHGPDSIEKRRRILRSLGAGGAIAGLPSLASATSARPHCKKDNKNYHASASAVGSMIGSVAGSNVPKYGHKCDHFRSGGWGSTWHNGYGTGDSKRRTIAWSSCGQDQSSKSKDWQNANCVRFWVLFGHTSDPGGDASKFCYEVLHGSQTAAANVWLVALLNANKLGSSFPYDPAGVVKLYHGFNPSFDLIGASADVNLSAKAVILFRDYLSQEA